MRRLDAMQSCVNRSSRINTTPPLGVSGGRTANLIIFGLMLVNIHTGFQSMWVQEDINWLELDPPRPQSEILRKLLSMFLPQKES
mmetsp:Transcript_33592/g.47729  ORF Transcript_33592/g.47729 Transcript_33592/m.47729 type:complete len:85 (+) Transcript_33592:10-264(+)